VTTTPPDVWVAWQRVHHIDMPKTLLRIVRADPERVWQLWTTASGLERWWSPDGYSTTVQHIDVVRGGSLRYTMTATGPEQVAALQQHGMPLTTQSRKTFSDVHRPHRLAYTSLIDFVPGQAPYEQLTVVDLEPVDSGTRIQMTMEPMHDDEWTERLVAGRMNELDNLGRLIDANHESLTTGPPDAGARRTFTPPR